MIYFYYCNIILNIRLLLYCTVCVLPVLQLSALLFFEWNHGTRSVNANGKKLGRIMTHSTSFMKSYVVIEYRTVCLLRSTIMKIPLGGPELLNIMHF